MTELTPYICVADAAAAIEWYREVLGAVVVVDPYVMEDGRIGHVELAIDGAESARWMMSDEYPAYGIAVPAPGRGAAVTLHLTVEDVDAVTSRVRSGGRDLDRGPEDVPGLGRVAVFHDPFSHRWFLTQPAS